MFLVIGLGNPGEKYIKTWHNVGFETLDKFGKENNFPDFKLKSKLKAEISEGSLSKEKVVLAKPQTFMNNSGTSAKAILNNWKMIPENIITVHDDIDLLQGEIRISKNRGSAGHRGVESVIKQLKTKDFYRIRIGIKPKLGKPKNPEMFVLKKLNKEGLKESYNKAVKAISLIIEGKATEAMTCYN